MPSAGCDAKRRPATSSARPWRRSRGSGTEPAAWVQSPDRGASIALWRIDNDAPHGFTTRPFADSHMVCVHLNGSMSWSAKMNDRSYRTPANANTFCIARAGESAEIEYSDAHLTFAHFHLPCSGSRATWSMRRLPAPRNTIELIDPMNAASLTVANLARQAVGAMRSGGDSARLRIDAALIELAAALVKHHSSAVAARPAKGGLAPAVLRRVVDYLVAHLAEKVTLAELRNLGRGNGPHFCRAFSVSTGVSPHRYQIMLRMQEATRCFPILSCRSPMSAARWAMTIRPTSAGCSRVKPECHHGPGVPRRWTESAAGVLRGRSHSQPSACCGAPVMTTPALRGPTRPVAEGASGPASDGRIGLAARDSPSPSYGAVQKKMWAVSKSAAVACHPAEVSVPDASRPMEALMTDRPKYPLDPRAHLDDRRRCRRHRLEYLRPRPVRGLGDRDRGGPDRIWPDGRSGRRHDGLSGLDGP